MYIKIIIDFIINLIITLYSKKAKHRFSTSNNVYILEGDSSPHHLVIAALSTLFNTQMKHIKRFRVVSLLRFALDVFESNT